jgi:hypothetical protein
VHLIRALRGIGDMDEEGTRVQRCWTEPVISALTDARAAVAKARADGATALDGKLPDTLRARYDTAVAWGIATNAHRDWPSGRHPGYTLARRLQARAAQVWRFAADFAVPFTNDRASYCTSCGGWEVWGLTGRSGGCRAGGFSVAGGSDILPWRAGAPGFAVGVAAA